VQDPRIAAQFPEIPRGRFDAAVQLIEVNGLVYSGAEAVFRALAHNPNRQWLLHYYKKSSAFASIAEWAYGFVVRRRILFHGSHSE
jgi:hypothetical protein